MPFRAETKGAKNKEESTEAEEENKDEEEQLESYVLTLTQNPKEYNEKDSEELLYQSQFEHCSQVILAFKKGLLNLDYKFKFRAIERYLRLCLSVVFNNFWREI